MEKNNLQKLFGVGPLGAAISLFLLAVCAWINSLVDPLLITVHAGPAKFVGVVLVVLGLALHMWSFFTLRAWWTGNQLCTKGPFRYFRHPMYAAWVTLICPGVSIYLNSWIYLMWVVLLHVIWHKLVKKEEKIMTAGFGDVYRSYARRTGRFFPRVLNDTLGKYFYKSDGG